ncbi:hypothetical protein KY290_021931 [Solanum tuberosum]|uniref:Zinc finger PHD-type domain-containing protein n=1 Tax=Solanum tuberosum TaxID=4113 RepID=A0ABQ7V4Z1_SOLTU|nr:hypothetical protein KY290_021931 [Solanum tuberosum]
MAGNPNIFSSFQSHKAPSPVTVGDGSTCNSLGAGTVKPTSYITPLSIRSTKIGLTRNLKCYISFFPGHCLFRDLTTNQMWTKLNEVGSKMISLSRSLSEISRGCFRAQVSGSVHVNAKDAKVEAISFLEEKQLLKIVGPEISNPSLATGKCMSPTKYLQLFQISWGTTQANNVTKLLEGSNPSSTKITLGDFFSCLVSKMEQAETYGVDKRCACQCCGEKEKADGGDSLACDSCEEIYHLSCVEPTVKEFPVRSWHCAKGMESPSSSVIIENEVEDLTSEDMVLELEDNTNGLVDGELKLCEGVEGESIQINFVKNSSIDTYS